MKKGFGLIDLLRVGWFVMFLGCRLGQDQDLKLGKYWLEQGNWQRAAEYFRKSLDTNPHNWQTHLLLLEALALSGEKGLIESQLRYTLELFPDSARSSRLSEIVSSAIGETSFISISGEYLKRSVAQRIKGEKAKPEELARGVIAACRSRDSSLVAEYITRLLHRLGDKPLPDSVRFETKLYLGEDWVEWIASNYRFNKFPEDLEALRKALFWTMVVSPPQDLKDNLKPFVSAPIFSRLSAEELISLGYMVGVSPFPERELGEGWDGVYTPGGEAVVYIIYRGREEPDPYFYRLDLSSGSRSPLMKAYQQALYDIAAPTFSPNGDYIYFFASPERGWKPGGKGLVYLYAFNPQWGAEVRRISDPDILMIPPYPTTKGTLLAVRRDLGSVRASVEVVEIDPKSKKKEVVVRIAEPVITGCFTPKGDSLLFITDRGLMRRSLAGGSVVVDLEWKGLNLCYLTSDGEWILLGREPRRLYIMNRRDGRLFYFGEWVTPYFSSQKGKLLVTRERNGRRSLWEFQLNPDYKVASQVASQLRSLYQ